MREAPNPAGESQGLSASGAGLDRRPRVFSTQIGSTASAGSGPILLVEDDPADAQLMMAALQSAGIPDDVIWVQTGEEALSYLEGTGVYSDRKAHPVPCLVLLDLKLSKLSGFHVLKRLRECPELMEVPTIVVTGSLDTKDVDRAFELGAESYIIKPTDFADLVETLRFKVNLCLQRTILMRVIDRGLPKDPDSEKNGN